MPIRYGPNVLWRDDIDPGKNLVGQPSSFELCTTADDCATTQPRTWYSASDSVKRHANNALSALVTRVDHARNTLPCTVALAITLSPPAVAAVNSLDHNCRTIRTTARPARRPCTETAAPPIRHRWRVRCRAHPRSADHAWRRLSSNEAHRTSTCQPAGARGQPTGRCLRISGQCQPIGPRRRRERADPSRAQQEQCRDLAAFDRRVHPPSAQVCRPVAR